MLIMGPHWCYIARIGNLFYRKVCNSCGNKCFDVRRAAEPPRGEGKDHWDLRRVWPAHREGRLRHPYSAGAGKAADRQEGALFFINSFSQVCQEGVQLFIRQECF